MDRLFRMWRHWRKIVIKRIMSNLDSIKTVTSQNYFFFLKDDDNDLKHRLIFFVFNVKVNII